MVAQRAEEISACHKSARKPRSRTKTGNILDNVDLDGSGRHFRSVQRGDGVSQLTLAILIHTVLLYTSISRES
jgi:hypothetical protein